jgi:pimeloyl-ACP methyl ester carboxylesterase
VVYSVLLVASAFLLVGVFIYFFQERLIFFPSRLSEDHIFRFDGNFEEMDFYPEENIRINALLFHGDPGRDVVFYVHGNAGNLDGWGMVADQFTPHGLSVLIYDFRGYGKSTGSISEKSLYKDALHIYDFLASQYGEQHIIVYGRSIGTGIASYVAAHRKPRKLFLESPYCSIPDLAGQLMPILPKVMVRYKFSNYAHLKLVGCPVIVIHGNRDEVIPVSQSKKLQPLLKDNDSFYVIEGGRHNDLETFSRFHAILAAQLL